MARRDDFVSLDDFIDELIMQAVITAIETEDPAFTTTIQNLVLDTLDEFELSEVELADYKEAIEEFATKAHPEALRRIAQSNERAREAMAKAESENESV